MNNENQNTKKDSYKYVHHFLMNQKEHEALNELHEAMLKAYYYMDGCGDFFKEIEDKIYNLQKENKDLYNKIKLND